ncbi:MFS transporter [Bacillus infantis]|uniref:MFS transporter n=2 Tax=Bacillus infantis TaxID=324767 RepID=A0A5D4SCN1_9BACI|nr:MFS transporter [Bacillus infantis]
MKGEGRMQTDRQTIIGMALLTAICMAGDSMLYIVLPVQWKEAGLSSLIQVGVLLSVNRFVRLPLNPLIGFFFKKVTFRNAMYIAVIFSGITTLGYGVVKDFELWILLRSIWGFCWSIFKIGAYLLILQLAADSNRGQLMGLYNGLYRLGSLFGMLLGGLFADLFGMSAISMILGFSVFIILPFLHLFLPEALHTNTPQQTGPTIYENVKLLKEPELIRIFLTAFLVMMLLDGMLTASLSHLIEIQYSDQVNIYGLAIGAAALAGIMQAIRWGIAPFVVSKVGTALDRTDEKHKILLSFLGVAAILLAVIPLHLPIAVWLPFLLLHLLTSSSLITVMDTLMSQYCSKSSGKVFFMTSYTIVIDLGAAVGPISGYSLEKAIGMANVFWLASGIMLLIIFMWKFFKPTELSYAN